MSITTKLSLYYNTTKNYFCEAVSLGIVRVSIPDGCGDLIDYCVSSLKRGIENPTKEFIISGLRFLYEKDPNGKDCFPYEQRKELLTYIINKLQMGRRENMFLEMPSWLSPEQKISVDMYTESVILLDLAVRRGYRTYPNNKKMFVVFLNKILAERLKSVEPNSPLAQLIL